MNIASTSRANGTGVTNMPMLKENVNDFKFENHIFRKPIQYRVTWGMTHWPELLCICRAACQPYGDDGATVLASFQCEVETQRRRRRDTSAIGRHRRQNEEGALEHIARRWPYVVPLTGMPLC